MKKLIVILSYITGCTAAVCSFAANHRHGAAKGLGEVADNLMGPVLLASNFVYMACLILGVSFIFASIIKYMEHRRSPLMVPISTVVFLVIAGFFLLLLPFTNYLLVNVLGYPPLNL